MLPQQRHPRADPRRVREPAHHIERTCGPRHFDLFERAALANVRIARNLANVPQPDRRDASRDEIALERRRVAAGERVDQPCP